MQQFLMYKIYPPSVVLLVTASFRIVTLSMNMGQRDRCTYSQIQTVHLYSWKGLDFKQYFIYILTWINIVERYGEKLNATQC